MKRNLSTLVTTLALLCLVCIGTCPAQPKAEAQPADLETFLRTVDLSTVTNVQLPPGVGQGIDADAHETLEGYLRALAESADLRFTLRDGVVLVQRSGEGGEDPLSRRITAGIRVQDMGIGHVLDMIAEQSGVDITVKPPLPGTATLEVPANATVGECLAALKQAAGVDFTVDAGGRITVQQGAPGEKVESAPPTPTPASPLDRGVPEGLRLMNVTLEEAARQLAELAGLTIDVCPGAEGELRMSLAAGTPLRMVLDRITQSLRLQWQAEADNVIKICTEQAETVFRATPTVPQPGLGFTVEDERLHVRGREIFFRGRPVKLVGLSCEAILGDKSFDMIAWLNVLAQRGINLVRLFLFSAWNVDVSPFHSENQIYDLEVFNPEYFNRLNDFLWVASQRGIVVQLCLVEPTQWKDDIRRPGRQGSPLVRMNNKQGLDGHYDAESPWFQTEGPAAQLLLSLVRRTIQTTSNHPNVLYELCNEPPPGTEPWHLWLAEHVRNALANTPANCMISVNVTDGFDTSVLKNELIDVWSVHTDRPTMPPDYSDKPCIVSTHGYEIGGDIREFVELACGVPGGHFEYQDHYFPPHRYWMQRLRAEPVSLRLPLHGGDKTDIGRFVRRMERMSEAIVRLERDLRYAPNAPVPADPPRDTQRLLFYGELYAGDQVIKAASYSTVASIDLESLDNRQAVRAAQFLRTKGCLSVIVPGEKRGLFGVRELLDTLYLDGRRDAVANVWAVLLDVADYVTAPTTVALYGSDPVRLRYQALIRQFEDIVRGAQTPWGERPYAHIRSLLIVGPSTDDRPSWGPWALDAQGQPLVEQPVRLLPAGLQILGLRLPVPLAGDAVQTQRLAAALQAGYPSVEGQAGAVLQPNGAPPLVLLVGTSEAEAGITGEAMVAAHEAFFEQAKGAPYAGLLWWRYDRMPAEAKEALVGLHEKQGKLVRGQ